MEFFVASSLYNGSQYRTSISSIQAGVRQTEPAAANIRHSMQVSANVMLLKTTLS